LAKTTGLKGGHYWPNKLYTGFYNWAGVCVRGCSGGGLTAQRPSTRLALVFNSSGLPKSSHDETEFQGVLYDSGICIGCRACEKACAKAHGLPKLEDEMKPGVLRKTSEKQRCVVNSYETKLGEVMCETSVCIATSLPALQPSSPSLVPVWVFFNGKAKPVVAIQKTNGFITATSLRIPQGVCSLANIISYLGAPGKKWHDKVGLDDLLVQITGDIKITQPKKLEGRYRFILFG